MWIKSKVDSQLSIVTKNDIDKTGAYKLSMFKGTQE